MVLKISRNIGIDNEGYVELDGYDLPAPGSISMTFNSREADALLLLATNSNASRRRRRQSGKVYI